MSDITKEQAVQRYDTLIEKLMGEPTPPQCNGFALTMRDATICLLQGQKLQLQYGNGWSWSKAWAVVGSVAISSGAACITIFKIVSEFRV